MPYCLAEPFAGKYRMSTVLLPQPDGKFTMLKHIGTSDKVNGTLSSHRLCRAIGRPKPLNSMQSIWRLAWDDECSDHGQPHVITWGAMGTKAGHESLKGFQYFIENMGGFQLRAFSLSPPTSKETVLDDPAVVQDGFVFCGKPRGLESTSSALEERVAKGTCPTYDTWPSTVEAVRRLGFQAAPPVNHNVTF